MVAGAGSGFGPRGSQRGMAGGKRHDLRRTHGLKPRTLQEFLKRNEEKLKEGRLTYSQLFGFWYTEAGPLDQVVHIKGKCGHEMDARNVGPPLRHCAMSIREQGG